MKVKKANVTEKVSVIEGFTKEFEEYLKGIKLKVDHKVTVEELKNSFTYTFATKALSLDSPIQVITVMNTIKDRYGRHLNDEAAGFLDCMCGKAYAYLSCLTTNLANQSKYQKLALSLFDKAYAKTSGSISSYSSPTADISPKDIRSINASARSSRDKTCPSAIIVIVSIKL